MALSLIELLKGADDVVQAGLIEGIVTVDEVVSSLPFYDLGAADRITWVREKALPTTSTPSSGATITADTALEFGRVSSIARRFVIDQDIDVLDAGAVGGMASARGKAVAAALKSLGRKYGNDIMVGNNNFTVTVNSFGGTSWTAATIVVGPGHDPRMPVGILRWSHAATTVSYKAPGDAEFGTAVAYTAGVKAYSDNPSFWATVNFTAGASAAAGDVVFTISVTGSSTPIDGITRLCAASQSISATGADGDNVSFALMDQLADLVTDKSGPKVYMMPSRTRRSFMALLRTVGGLQMRDLMGPIAGMGQAVQIPMYNGIPILRSDWISIAETTGATTTTGRIYCATLGEEGGLCGTYSTAAVDAADAGEIIAVGPNGMVVENLGTVQTADAKRMRVKAYWGLASKSEIGLAQAIGIKN